MPENDLYTRLGKLEAKAELHHDMLEEIQKSVKQMELTLAERKAGTKYLFVLLTVAAAVGGLIDRAVAWLKLI